MLRKIIGNFGHRIIKYIIIDESRTFEEWVNMEMKL